MISDVLLEAIVVIRRYQSDYPNVYGRMDEVDDVVAKMEALRIKLDTPPHIPLNEEDGYFEYISRV